MKDVEMNLESFRCSNFDSNVDLNEDCNDARGCELVVSAAGVLPSIAGWNLWSSDEDSNLGNAQVDDVLTLVDEVRLKVDGWNESKEFKALMKDLDAFLLLKMSSTFLSSSFQRED